MNSFTSVLKSVGLGLFLIFGAAAVLLYSDLSSRHRDAGRRAQAARSARVAIVQHTSISALEDGVQGVLAALKERGYVDGGRMTVRRYNAEGDISTANAIAKEITSADYDLIISVSTVTLQTIANANRYATPPRRHVFGLVSDPYGAGVGVNAQNHADHPAYMTGFGSLPPVADTFKLARQMRPGLKRVGLVWNPTETNSVAATNLARSICTELGITLIEANAENATSVAQSAASLLSREVEAIWVSPDQTVTLGIDSILSAAKRARIPVFTSLPGNINKGSLFDLGADYPAIGRTEGQLAADVLDGRLPSQIPVENVVPVRLEINRLTAKGLRERWELPDSVLKRANSVLDDSGIHLKDQPIASAGVENNRITKTGPLPEKMTVDLIEYIETPNAELAREGLMAGLQKSGLVLGKDFDLRRHAAQGDIATLSSIIDTAITQHTNLMITSSTPALQSALARGRGTPIVFTMVSNPVIVGAGKSDTNHLPFVTGAYLDQPVTEMLEALKHCVPRVHHIGTVYTPAEINSVYDKEKLEKAARRAGFEFESVGITASSDIGDAVTTLAGRHIDVLVQITDNLIASGFPALMSSARRSHLPVVTYSPTVADMGPMFIIARDYYDNGLESGQIAARVLRGESTADIPFLSVPKLNYVVNLKVAESYHVRIPQELVSKASRVIR
jgi:putative tryptophan/tyrosine transport system substrate-binding protein